MNASELQIEFEKIINRDYFSDKFKPIREKAFEDFTSKGFPNKKLEDWRFTNLSRLYRNSFVISNKKHNNPVDVNLKKFHIQDVYTIVFVNGHYNTKLSDKINGVQLMTGLEYFEYKNTSTDCLSNCPFELLNTAFMDSGLSIVINKNQTLDKPIRFLFVASDCENIMISPKINIDCGENSFFTFLHHFVGDSSHFFTNSSISCSLEKNSSMRHIKIISDSKNGIIFNKINVQQKQNSRFDFIQFCYDSNLSRTKIETRLDGEGAECSLNGISLSRKNQQLGTHIVTNHFTPNCWSNQNFKNILLDNSSGIFNGKTVVHKHAQKTDSQQSNKNLILSKNALMNSNPQLEIYADDVKCSHGSTTGALDEDALFYLRSRGLNLIEAKKLLIRGFAIELFEELKHEPTKNFIIDKFESWLMNNAA